jgi:hypothetical protein
MKRFTLLFVLVAGFLCSILSGCGKEAGSEFVGTWKYAGTYDGEPYEYFYVIEKAKNGDTTYIITRYELDVNRMKKAFSGKIELNTQKKQFPAQYKDGILEKDFSEKYYIQDGKLVVGNKNLERVSDKSMTFEEMDNGRGYPAPQ